METKKITIIFQVLILTFLFNSFTRSEQVKMIQKLEIGTSGTKKPVFFKVKDISVDREGNIFVLDSGEPCVKKFSKNGKFISQTGREGQGPGEMIGPRAIVVDENGYVFVNDSRNRRINIYDNELNYLDTLKLEKPLAFEDFFLAKDGNFLMFHTVRLAGEKYFHLFTSKGKYLTSFFDKLHPLAPRMKSMKEVRNYLSRFIYISAVSAVNKNKARIAFAHGVPENPYKVYFLDMKGKVQKVITNRIKKYSPSNQRDLWDDYAKNKVFPKNKIDLIHIIRLNFSKEDYLLVQRTKTYYENRKEKKVTFSVDVFSPEGNLAAEEMDCRGEILEVDSKNNVYVLVDDDSETLKIFVYSLIIER